MKGLRYSTKAKKDLKKYRNDPRKMQKLYEVLDMLVCDLRYLIHFFHINCKGITKVVWNAISKETFSLYELMKIAKL